MSTIKPHQSEVDATSSLSDALATSKTAAILADDSDDLELGDSDHGERHSSSSSSTDSGVSLATRGGVRGGLTASGDADASDSTGYSTDASGRLRNTGSSSSSSSSSSLRGSQQNALLGAGRTSAQGSNNSITMRLLSVFGFGASSSSDGLVNSSRAGQSSDTLVKVIAVIACLAVFAIVLATVYGATGTTSSPVDGLRNLAKTYVQASANGVKLDASSQSSTHPHHSPAGVVPPRAAIAAVAAGKEPTDSVSLVQQQQQQQQQPHNPLPALALTDVGPVTVEDAPPMTKAEIESRQVASSAKIEDSAPYPATLSEEEVNRREKLRKEQESETKKALDELRKEKDVIAAHNHELRQSIMSLADTLQSSDLQPAKIAVLPAHALAGKWVEEDEKDHAIDLDAEAARRHSDDIDPMHEVKTTPSPAELIDSVRKAQGTEAFAHALAAVTDLHKPPPNLRPVPSPEEAASGPPLEIGQEVQPGGRSGAEIVHTAAPGMTSATILPNIPDTAFELGHHEEDEEQVPPLPSPPHPHHE